MTTAQAETRISEDVKEFWNGRNADEVIRYFTLLPLEHQHLVVNSTVSSALDKKEADVVLVADAFLKVAGEHVPEEVFEQGLLPTVESVDDLSVNAPKAHAFVARFLCGIIAESQAAHEHTPVLPATSIPPSPICSPLIRL